MPKTTWDAIDEEMSRQAAAITDFRKNFSCPDKPKGDRHTSRARNRRQVVATSAATVRWSELGII